jgi:type II secretory pathway pseudopilin PulG
MLVASISRDVLNSFPDWQLFVGIVGGVVVVSLIGHLLARRYLAPLRSPDDTGLVAGVTGIVMTLFAFVLAFAVVSLYDQFNEAKASVAGETAALIRIVQDSSGFPTRRKELIDTAIRDYVKEVNQHEFKAMHDGKASVNDPARTKFRALFKTLQNYEPKTEAQKAFYGSAIASLNDALTQRRTRLDLVDAAIPQAFATLIFLTAILSIVTTFFIATKNKALEFVLVSFIAIIVGTGLITVLLLQYPFSGSVSVSAKPFGEGFLPCIVNAPPNSPPHCP